MPLPGTGDEFLQVEGWELPAGVTLVSYTPMPCFLPWEVGQL